MTREELDAKIVSIDARMKPLRARADAIRAPIDAHNNSVGLWGRWTGDGIDLQEYDPYELNPFLKNVFPGSRMAEFADKHLPADVGDKPEYYELTKQLHELEREKIATQKQLALMGGTPTSGSTTNPVASQYQSATTSTQSKPVSQDTGKGFSWVKNAVDIANKSVATTDKTGKAGKALQKTTGSTTATTTSVDTTASGKSTKKVKPTYKEVVNVEPITQQVANEQPIVFGDGSYVIPSNGFTSDHAINGAPITIDPVNFYGDNGGLQHGAMNALYQTKPASFGEMLAFANLMQGKRDFSGGVGAITQTMQDFDKLNAYSAQADVAGRVQDLLAQGYGMNEARYLALSEYGVQNGYNRMAVSATLPEYAKYADERAGREMDTLAATGGNYRSMGAFGYNPLGVNSFHSNGDGSMDLTVNGQRVTNAPMEYGLNGVYAAIKGDGSGSSNSATRWANEQDKAWQYGYKLAEGDLDILKFKYGIGSEEPKEDAFNRAYKQTLGRKLAEEEAKKRGNTTGFKFTY